MVQTKNDEAQSYDRVRQMLDLLPEAPARSDHPPSLCRPELQRNRSAYQLRINTALGRMRYGLINLRKMMTQKKIAL